MTSCRNAQISWSSHLSFAQHATPAPKKRLKRQLHRECLTIDPKTIEMVEKHMTHLSRTELSPLGGNWLKKTRSTYETKIPNTTIEAWRQGVQGRSPAKA